jgi:spore germination protein GerM
MAIDKKKALLIVLFLLLFGGGIAGGYLFVSKRYTAARVEKQNVPESPVQGDDSAFVRVYYPTEGRLVMEERKIKRASEISMAEETVGEFLKGPSKAAGTGKSVIPQGTKVLGLYPGSDGILYVDLSDEFRRNFQGDAAAEFLLLRGLYESVISNVKGVDDVKILIEGKEIESVGGHLLALSPLKATVGETNKP